MIFGRSLGQDATTALTTTGASVACSGGGPLAALACGTLAAKLAYNEGTLKLTPGRENWRPCLSPGELRPGETLQEAPDGVWCVPRPDKSTCADAMAWNTQEWRRLGRSPTEYPGGGGRYTNPYGVIACRDPKLPGPPNVSPEAWAKVQPDYQGHIHVLGPMPWGVGSTAPGQAVFTAQLAPGVVMPQYPTTIPPGAFAVYDPDIGQYRILVAA